MGRHLFITLKRLGFLSFLGSTASIAELDSLSTGLMWKEMWGSVQPTSSLSIAHYITPDNTLSFRQTDQHTSRQAMGGAGILLRTLMKTESSLLWGLELALTLPVQSSMGTSLQQASYQGITYKDTLRLRVRPIFQGATSFIIGRRWKEAFLAYFRVGAEVTTASLRHEASLDDHPFTTLGAVHKTWVNPTLGLGIGYTLTPLWEVGAEVFFNPSRSLALTAHQGDTTAIYKVKVRQAGVRFQLIYHLRRHP